MTRISPTLAIATCFAGGAILFTGCKQYPYSSPLPGLIEVRLKTVSQSIPYGPLNTFPMSLSVVRAIRNDNVKLEVYEDITAIRRSPHDVDLFSQDAFDSTLVIGQADAPPGTYIGLDVILDPDGFVLLDGYRFINVTDATADPSFISLRRPITIEESRTTIVTVTFNADSSLVKGAEDFKYYPTFYVSSVGIR